MRAASAERAVLFDVDGTLINALANQRRCWHRWADLFGVDSDETYRVALQMRPTDAFAVLKPDEDPAWCLRRSRTRGRRCSGWLVQRVRRGGGAAGGSSCAPVGGRHLELRPPGKTLILSNRPSRTTLDHRRRVRQPRETSTRRLPLGGPSYESTPRNV